MTKDYAKPSTPRKSPGPAKRKQAPKRPAKKTAPPSKGPSKAKLFFTLAVLISLSAYGIYMLQSVQPTNKLATEPNNKPAPAPAAKKESSALANEPETATEKRFEFYNLLPESEVIAPKVESYQFKEKATGTDFYYLVQTGSFRSSSDAERQKATIAFQGLKAQINPVQNDEGSIWYRVMTGPFYSRSEMNSALDKLVNIGIEPLVKKIKKTDDA